MTNNTPPNLAHRPWMPFAILGLMWLVYALVVIPTWGWTYWDFGDGNYMYIARRMREGLVLYRDILAPQPPLHTLGGVLAQEFGARILGNELYGVRTYCLVVRLLGSLFVMLLALRAFRCPFRALAAAAVYLSLPIGFWWSLCYQSENLEIVFLVAAMWLLLSWKRNQVIAAGVCSALACHCNMTGLPYMLANALFLAFRMPRLLPWYLGPAIGVYTVIAVVANLWTEGFFVTNVLLNQAGTFPRSDILAWMSGGQANFWTYAWGKIRSQSWETIAHQGPLIAVAIATAAYLVAKMPARTHAANDTNARNEWLTMEFLAWHLIAGLLSICFTAKGGTVNYIFVLGEPMVALFAGAGIVIFFRKALPSREEWKRLSLFDTTPLLRALFPIAALGVVYTPSIQNLRYTLDEVQVELPESSVQELRGFIRHYAEPGDVILAPPFYAYATGTIVAAELAENYIWQIKWLNETFDMDNYGGQPGEGIAKMEELAEMLRRREVKVVLLDTAQTGQTPVVRQALDEHYQRAEPDLYITRNTRLELLVPKNVTVGHIPLGQ